MFHERFKRASWPKKGSKSNSTVAKKGFQEKDSFDFATKDTNRFSPAFHNSRSRNLSIFSVVHITHVFLVVFPGDVLSR
jgi:hypothetical protein